MNRISTTFFLAVTSTIILSCATPAPISKLDATSENAFFWQNGRQVLVQNEDSIFVELAYQQRAGELFVFDITIANESSEDILIDPSQFLYIPITKAGDSLGTVHAENPEKRILEQDIQVSKLTAQRTNELISAAFWATLEVTAGVAAAIEGEPIYDEHDDDYIYYHRSNMAEIEFEEWDALEQKDYWENQAIRKTTLFPGHFITGQILMKRERKSDTLWILIPIQNYTFEFFYNHQLIEAQ